MNPDHYRKTGRARRADDIQLQTVLGIVAVDLGDRGKVVVSEAGRAIPRCVSILITRAVGLRRVESKQFDRWSCIWNVEEEVLVVFFGVNSGQSTIGGGHYGTCSSACGSSKAHACTKQGKQRDEPCHDKGLIRGLRGRLGPPSRVFIRHATHRQMGQTFPRKKTGKLWGISFRVSDEHTLLESRILQCRDSAQWVRRGSASKALRVPLAVAVHVF